MIIALLKYIRISLNLADKRVCIYDYDQGSC